MPKKKKGDPRLLNYDMVNFRNEGEERRMRAKLMTLDRMQRTYNRQSDLDKMNFSVLYSTVNKNPILQKPPSFDARASTAPCALTSNLPCGDSNPSFDSGIHSITSNRNTSRSLNNLLYVKKVKKYPVAKSRDSPLVLPNIHVSNTEESVLIESGLGTNIQSVVDEPGRKRERISCLITSDVEERHNRREKAARIAGFEETTSFVKDRTEELEAARKMKSLRSRSKARQLEVNTTSQKDDDVRPISSAGNATTSKAAQKLRHNNRGFDTPPCLADPTTKDYLLSIAEKRYSANKLITDDHTVTTFTDMPLSNARMLWRDTVHPPLCTGMPDEHAAERLLEASKRREKFEHWRETKMRDSNATVAQSPNGVRLEEKTFVKFLPKSQQSSYIRDAYRSLLYHL